MNYLIIGAMLEDELSAIIAALDNKKDLSFSGIPLYKGKLSDKSVYTCVTGIGKTQGSFTLSAVLSKYDIDLIINIGIAGATAPYKVGDHVIVSKTRYHDFNLTAFGYEVGRVPGKPQYFKSDETYFKKIMNNKMKSGILLTGDTFLTEKLPIKAGYLVDMEGCALFHVAYNFNKKIISLKIVSDILGETKIDEYNEFSDNNSAEMLKTFLMEVMDKI